MSQVAILNQLVVNFMKTDQNLKNKNEKSSFLVVKQITNDDFKKEFIIVPMHISLKNSKGVLTNVTSIYIKNNKWVDFSDYCILIEINGKYFIKQQNQDQVSSVRIIQQYQNNNDYDLNDKVFKEKMKWLWFDENYAPIIVEFNNKYMKIENKKIFLNDPFFKYDNTSERNALELLQKQLDINVNEKQLIKNIAFTSNTRELITREKFFENDEVDIKLEVEFQLPNKPLTCKLILESQKFKIVNCENLKSAYYEEINDRFLCLEYLFNTISETKKELDSFVKDKLPLIEELNTYLKQAAANVSESYHRDLNYGNENLLSKIKQYAEYIINIKKQEIFYKLVENKELNDLTAAFFTKYQTIKKHFNDDTKFKKINHYQNFDHDYAIIEKILLKELNLKQFSCSEMIKQFNFKKVLHSELDLYSIKKITFKEKVGSFINKILITLKLKKPSETVINSQRKINEIQQIINSICTNYQKTSSKDCLNATNEESNYEQLLQPPALSSDLKFWLKNNETQLPEKLSQSCEEEHIKVKISNLENNASDDFPTLVF